MKKYDVFHGTPYQSGKELLEKGKGAVRIKIPTTKQLFSGTVKKPGSLGFGFYTFMSDKVLAEEFASQFTEGRVLVLKIKVDLEDDFTLRFDSSTDDMIRFRAFLDDPSRKKDIEYLRRKYQNTSKQSELDGALLELYCAVSKEGHVADIKAICSPTHSRTKNEVVSSNVPNGIEVLIKDKAIIVSDNFEVVH